MDNTWKIYKFDTLSSTMDKARELLDTSQNAYCAVLAKEQTQGRGRYNRQWTSPAGNFYGTLALPIQSFKNAPFFSYIAALAVLDTVKHFIQEKASITLKWPNDILVNGKKIAGILLEVEETSKGLMLLIGSGINLKSHPKETPYPATNLLEFGIDISPEDILQELLKRFDHWRMIFEKEGFEPIRQHWLLHRDPNHKTMTLKHYEKGVEINRAGSFVDLDEEGYLVLQCGKEIKKFNVGDVFFT